MIKPLNRLGRIATLLVLVGLSGCFSTMYPRVDMPPTAPIAPAAQVPPPATNGAIFQTASYRPLFEDRRARLVGDTLTVVIVERITASQSSTSKVDKSGKVEASVSALPGVPSKAFARGTASGSSNNAFEGKGSTENSNDFTGTITVTVGSVLPNGHLVVSGEKQIGVNDNVDVLRFSGQVDPRTIQAGNSVPSTQVANVRLEQRGRGPQAEAQAVGWLLRVFLSYLPI